MSWTRARRGGARWAAVVVLGLGVGSGCSIDRIGKLAGDGGRFDAGRRDAGRGDRDSGSGVDGGSGVDAGMVVPPDVGPPAPDAGPGCVEGAACSTGLAGPCEPGVIVCRGAMPVCSPVTAAGREVCNGVDDDCNGVVDDGTADTDCPPGTVCASFADAMTPLHAECVGLACTGDPCCAVSASPCPAGWTCEHAVFDSTECLPGCGDCGNCHVCVYR